MNRTKTFFNNSFFSLVHQIVVFISGFIILKIILLEYGSEINGFINSITQFIGYFKLVEAGLSGAAIYALYKPLATKNFFERNNILTSAKKLYYKAGIIFVLLIVSLALIYPIHIDLVEYSYIYTVFLIMILSLSTVIDFFLMAKYRVLLTADQKLFIISIASSIQLLISTIIIVICSKLNFDLLILYLISSTTVFLRSYILSSYVKKNYTELNFRAVYDKSLLSQKWDVLYNQILNMVQNGAPILILTISTQNLLIISVYAVYSLVIGGINNVLNIFKGGLYTGFGDIIARNENDRLKKVFNDFEIAYQFILVTILSVTSIVLTPFIEIYTSGINDANYVDNKLVILFILNCYLYNLKVPHGMLIIGAGHYKKTRTAVTIQGLLLLGFGFILTPIYGIYGVLYASIISNIYRTIEMLIYVPKNILKIEISKTIIKYIFMSIILILNYFIINYITNDFHINSLVKWLLYTLLVFSAVCITQLLIWYLIYKNDVYIIKNRIKVVLSKR